MSATRDAAVNKLLHLVAAEYVAEFGMDPDAAVKLAHDVLAEPFHLVVAAEVVAGQRRVRPAGRPWRDVKAEREDQRPATIVDRDEL